MPQILKFLKILFITTIISVVVLQIFISSINSKVGGLNFSILRKNSLSGLQHRNVSKMAALNHSLKTSFLIGTGAAKKYYDLLPSINSINGGVLNLRNPDSSFSVIILRYGIVGLILYFIFLLLLLVNVYRIYKNTQNRSIKIMAIGLLGTLGAYFIQFWVDPLFNMVSYTMWFFVSYGVILGVVKNNISINNQPK